ncbi:hypothetical protein IW262DRAFT_1385352 [Armillaria fumosa]|nr:hypothetical protein IW262DRAFT_1385352 [Armillaria fumosa]
MTSVLLLRFIALCRINSNAPCSPQRPALHSSWCSGRQLYSTDRSKAKGSIRNICAVEGWQKLDFDRSGWVHVHY